MTLASAGPRTLHAVTPPRWPTLMLGFYAVVATLSVLQGIADVVIPVMTGAPVFGFLFGMTDRWGPAFFIGYIFVHNLGLACLVPGYGFLAAYYEKRTVNRGLIGVLLMVAVLASLLVAGHFILRAPQMFDLPLTLALLVGETCGVLALAVAGAEELRGFVPTPRYEWSLVHPFRRLHVPLGYSAVLLLVLSIWEAHAVIGFL